MDGQTNLKNVFRTTELPISQKNSIIQSVTDSYDTVKQNLIKGSIKLQIVANVEFEKPNTSESINTHISTKQHSLTRIEDLDKIFKDNLIADLVDAIDHAKVRGSGWSEATVHKLEMKQTRYHPILGKSFLPLPKEVEKKRAVVNIQNKSDNFCFKWCVLAKLFPIKVHPERISHYKPFENKLDFSGLTFPMSIEDIDRFEEQNPPISVNVYKWVEDSAEKIVPLRASKNAPSFGQDETKHADLLLLTEGEKQHYALISSMSRLISFTSGHDGKQELCKKMSKAI